MPLAPGIFQRHEQTHHLQSSPSFSRNTAVTPVQRGAGQNPTNPLAAAIGRPGSRSRDGLTSTGGSPAATAAERGRSRTGPTRAELRSCGSTSPAPAQAPGDGFKHLSSSTASCAGAEGREGGREEEREGAARQDRQRGQAQPRPLLPLRTADPAGRERHGEQGSCPRRGSATPRSGGLAAARRDKLPAAGPAGRAPSPAVEASTVLPPPLRRRDTKLASPSQPGFPRCLTSGSRSPPPSSRSAPPAPARPRSGRRHFAPKPQARPGSGSAHGACAAAALRRASHVVREGGAEAGRG